MRFALLLFAIMLVPQPVLAHKVIVFAYTEGGGIVAEGSFPGGRPCKECPMSVENTATGEVLLEGMSDDAGIWRFELPPAAAGAAEGVTVVLDGGEGHRAEWRLEPDEYLALTDAAPPAAKTPVAPEKKEAPAPADAAATPSAPAGMTAEVLEQTLSKAIAESVSEAVSREIAPLKRQLLKDEGPQLRDVLGGIGYIFGLAGILAWARSRKR